MAWSNRRVILREVDAIGHIFQLKPECRCAASILQRVRSMSASSTFGQPTGTSTMVLKPICRKLILVAVASISSGFPMLLTATADAQDAGFQSSCNRISIIGATLEATCRRQDGSYQRTSIVLQGIENVDGQLQFTHPGQAATFQSSCRHVHVTGATLTAAGPMAAIRTRRLSFKGWRISTAL